MPDWQQYVRARLPRLTVSSERETEIVAELALQLEGAWQAALAGGVSEDEALRQAGSQIRDWASLARAIDRAERPAPRPAEPGGIFSGALADARYALRFFLRSPGFTALAALTLGIGIGGNTAIFTLVDAVVFRGVPYPHPERLMAIETRKTSQPEVEPWTSGDDLADMRARLHSFSAIAGISPRWSKLLTGRGAAERLETLYVSAEFFPMLGVRPALGRTFTQQEDRAGAGERVAVLSYPFWERQFGGSPRAIGRTLMLDGDIWTVIGVLPAGFRYAGEPVAGTVSEIDAWFPRAANPSADAGRSLRMWKVAGRLKPGVTVGHAGSEVAALSAALAEQYPATERDLTTSIEPLSRQVTGRFRGGMFLLLATVGFVLLMACANVAGLLLARASARRQEISVRLALGASRFRLLRQLLTEGLLLAAIGGAAGLGLAYGALDFMIRTGPQALVRAFPIRIDPTALFLTASVVLLCAILAGLPPAWRMLREDVNAGLRESGRGLTAGSHRLRAALVVLQVSVALSLSIGAGLLVRSFQQLLDVDPGFQPRHLLTISTLVYQAAPTPQQRTALWHRFHDDLMAVPGVSGVAAASRLPLMGSSVTSWLNREGHIVPGRPAPEIEYRVATPNYFQVMGIPLRAGRLFDDHDNARAYAVAVINEAAARRFWPGENPIGTRMKLGAPDSPWVTVIGVIGNVRHVALDTEPPPEVYRPYAVNPLVSPILVIRTTGDPEALRAALAAKVRGVSPDVSAYNVYSMEELVDRSTAERRFVMLLLGGFAAVALLLAGIGIYGTVLQAVSQRTQEIGLRMALGASPSSALFLVLADGFWLVLAGMGTGLAASLFLTQLMKQLLFGVRPLDPATFAAAPVLLAALALLACYIPARRATRIDPLAALRSGG